MVERSGPDERTSIEGFELVERLGAGGFGTVYRAADVRHGRDVAIKVLEPMRDESAERRFDRECRAMGTLSGHPNIAVVHTSGTTADGRPYLAMELLGGGSLADRIRQRGPLPAEEVVELGLALCDGLAHAHAGGVLHLDMKPENVLFSPFGQPKIVDFGIAALIGDEDGTGTIRATPSFADPMVLDGKAGTTSSDVYGVAATLFAALSGEPPYGSDGVVATLRRISTEPVPRVQRVDVPGPLADVLQGAMAHDSSERPHSVDELRRRLESAAVFPAPPPRPHVDPHDRSGAAPSTAAPATSATTAAPDRGTRVAPDSRRRWSTVLGAGMLAVAAVIVGVLLFSRGGGDGDAGNAGMEPETTVAVTTAPSVPEGSAVDTVVIPDVSGRSEAVARTILESVGLQALRGNGCGSEVRRLDPAAGEAVAPGDIVELLFEQCRVPDFVGLRLPEAIERIESYDGLTISWPSHCDDLVLDQSPVAGSIVAQGTDIVLELPMDC